MQGIVHPVVALVGRPNVGKSTLFNRLLGARRAVVSSVRGTTRDRVSAVLERQEQRLTLIDTGGFEFSAAHDLERAVHEQVQRAIQEADVVLLVADAEDGVLPADELILERLRVSGKPLVVAVNKLDRRPMVPPDFLALGVPAVVGVSALLGRGLRELLNVLTRATPLHDPAARTPVAPTRPPVALALVGRPNVGKSSLLNALMGDARAIVSDVPATTRDVIDTILMLGAQQLVLLDTPGLRHRRKVKQSLDRYSMARTIETLRRADVAAVVLDATQGVTRDDHRVIDQAMRAGCGLMLVANKWDLIPGADARRAPGASLVGAHRAAEPLARVLPLAQYVPVLAVSAKTGFQVRHILTVALQVAARRAQSVPESELFEHLRVAWTTHPPPRIRGHLATLRAVHRIPGRSLRLSLTTHPPVTLPAPYQHYLLKQLHKDPRLFGVPVMLVEPLAHVPMASGGEATRRGQARGTTHRPRGSFPTDAGGTLACTCQRQAGGTADRLLSGVNPSPHQPLRHTNVQSERPHAA